MTDEVARVEIDGLENEQLLDCNEILRTYIFQRLNETIAVKYYGNEA